MSQLVPCPECQRHVRKTETRCPFCSASVSLAHVPSPVLPSRRLGRAATFAFGASIVGAAAIVSCSDDEGDSRAIYGGPPASGAGGEGSDQGGGGPMTDGGTDSSPGGMTAIYGGPPAGAGGQEIGGNGPVNEGGM